MNLKRAKKLRKFWNGESRPSWRDKRYTDSNHPDEKPHTVMYNNIPMKVGTIILQPTCGRSLYKESKKAQNR